MNTAIIYLKNEKEQDLALAKYLGTDLLTNIINKLKKLDLDELYVVGLNKERKEAKTVATLQEVIEKLVNEEGKSLLLSPFYPELELEDLRRLLNGEGAGFVLSNEDEILNVFKLDNKDLDDYTNISYKAIEIEKANSRKINNMQELEKFSREKRIEINKKLLEKGVNILDIEDTFISQESVIGKGCTIYPGVFIEGVCKIGENTTITAGSHLIDAEVGNDCTILNSRIDSSIVHNNVSIGPNSHLRGHSEVFDKCRIGNFVEFKNTKFGVGSKCAHLTYLGDSTVGEGVNIGCGVVTVNYDGVHKFPTIIKDHAFIGSNANIIAPVTVGEYAVIAAGSTVNKDVPDRDMAIARVRQENKSGYGYKYINKEK